MSMIGTVITQNMITTTMNLVNHSQTKQEFSMTTFIPEWTAEKEQQLVEYLETNELVKGRYQDNHTCSMGAINLVILGWTAEMIPSYMSKVIGNWIIGIQDYMPHEMRNSSEWKSCLPKSVNTGREKETERMKILVDWCWDTVLPTMQSAFTQAGYGVEYQQALHERDVDAIYSIYHKYPSNPNPHTIDHFSLAACEIVSGIENEYNYPFAIFGTIRGIKAAQLFANDDYWTTINPPKVFANLIAA